MRYTFLLFVCFLQFPLTAQTDVLNGGFEDWNESSNLPIFWSCECIVFGFCDFDPNEKTTDSYAGNYALLLHNVICSEGERIGNMHSYSLDNPYGYGTLISTLPENFSFYYKFLPTGDDVAFASITLFQYDSTATSWWGVFDTIAFSQEYIINAQNSYAVKTMSVNYINPIDYSREVFLNVEFKILGQNQTTKLFIDDVHVFGNLGLFENTGTSDLFLYPNPATSQVHLMLNDGESIQLRDLKGEEIHISPQNLTENIYVFDVSKLEKGVYLVTIYSDFGQKTERLVVFND